MAVELHEYLDDDLGVVRVRLPLLVDDDVLHLPEPGALLRDLLLQRLVHVLGAHQATMFRRISTQPSLCRISFCGVQTGR